MDFTAKEKANLEKMLEIQPRINELTEEILQRNPSLGITALVMAGDYANAERVDKAFQRGEFDFQRAQMLIGSYARFGWVVKQVVLGRVDPKEAYVLLPELWSGSDPDDTDLNFLEFWKSAHKANRGRLITDSPDGLPKYPKNILVIYRGQDRDVEQVGIAWTLDRQVAIKFAKGAWARQSGRDGVILTARIPARNVLAYITGRGEKEIIVDPNQFGYTRSEI